MNEKAIAKTSIVSDDNIYQKMIEEIEDYAIILLDLNGTVKSWNKGAEKIKGYTAEEIIGKNYSQFYTQADRDALLPQRSLEEAKIKGKVVTEGWRIKKDGTLFWISSVLTALHDHQTNKIIGFSKVVRDVTERKKIEEEREFLSSIVRNIYDPIICADTSNRITDWNKPAEDLLGWKKEEVLGKMVIDVLKLEYPNDKREDVIKAYYSKGYWQGETIYYTKSGEPLNMLVTASYIKSVDGLVSGTVVLARNITQRIKAEQALAKLNIKLEERIKERTEEIFNKQKLFQSLIENEFTITALLDENLQTIYRSPSAEAITGWTNQEREKLKDKSIFHPDEVAIQDKMVKDMIANPGKPIYVSFRSMHKDGHYIWLEGTGTNRLYDPFINAFVINLHDITERKKSEDEVKSNEEKYHLLIDRISDGFIALDKNFRYIYANRKIGKMTGMNPESLIGRNIWEVFPEAVGSETYAAFNKAMEKQHYIYNVDYYEQLALWQENHIYPSPEGLSVFIRDISERKRAEKLINDLNDSLEERVRVRTEELTAANKALESFSYMVSHDLQSPLRTLINFTNIIVEKYSSQFEPSLKDLFNFILSSSKRMNLIIDDLLKLAKFGKVNLNISTIKMTQLFQKVWDDLGRNVPNKAHLTLEELPDIEGDASMMEQAIVNLLSNAIKYSSKTEHPQVTVGYLRGNEKINTTFFVKDNGVGFNMEFYNKLFGAFQRLHNTNEFEGTGIGLLLVKRVIENHGGTVWAESKVNEGATFYFTIPSKK